MAGELSDPNDEGEEDIVQTARVPVQTSKNSRFPMAVRLITFQVHQFCLFKFWTEITHCLQHLQSRAAIFGFDTISLNLFNTRSGSIRGDVFGGSINGHKRSKSSVSRSSTIPRPGESSIIKFSHRSNSTATAATSMSAMNDDVFFASKPVSKSEIT